ncbi:uncharacterized protein LOC116255375 [Nymphaea colorata]|uniref:uncharacterized protein LOC116255375 n=1 Tax=Nymphaea colorata TaxID=210225 RepID=UPI00129D79F9|nr:uncharacterized protein LOC116255375 [Nymphaea colorata]
MDSLAFSLETEPMTLLSEQLDMAREQALTIMKKVPPEEAARIFTKGLKPVEDLGMKETHMRTRGKKEHKAKNSCKFCTCTDVAEENPDNSEIVEPLTAPF